jgi:uncharacterized protein YndB with AHSA1/START domain
VNVTESVVIAASPEAVWRVAGEVTAVADWVPGIDSCRMEGDLRRMLYAGGGGEATERIVEHDDRARSYSYEYLSRRRAFDLYRPRLSVRDHCEGSEVVWASEFTAGSEEADAQLVGAIRDRYRAALEALKKGLES